jgi:hypothetical protein
MDRTTTDHNGAAIPGQAPIRSGETRMELRDPERHELRQATRRAIRGRPGFPVAPDSTTDRSARTLVLACSVSFALYLLNSHAVRAFLRDCAALVSKIVPLLSGG